MIIKQILIRCIFLIAFLCGSIHLFAQEKANTEVKIAVNDTLKIIHSPKKAATYSAILPGLGQAYNKKYWKIPFVYAGFGAIGFFINWNNSRLKIAKNAYVEIANWKTTPYDVEQMTAVKKIDAIKHYDLNNVTSRNNFLEGLSRQQDYYRRNRDLLIISTFGFYGLNIIDASVDAHFFDFDMSDDLSFNWQPSLINVNNKLVYGFNCNVNF